MAAGRPTRRDMPRLCERLREAVPHGLVSITSIRPEGIRVEEILDLLAALAGDPATKPDLISVNLGHIVAWEPVTADPVRRRTVALPQCL